MNKFNGENSRESKNESKCLTREPKLKANPFYY